MKAPSHISKNIIYFLIELQGYKCAEIPVQKRRGGEFIQMASASSSHSLYISLHKSIHNIITISAVGFPLMSLSSHSSNFPRLLSAQPCHYISSNL